jgi:hypothetical protein
MGEWRTIDSAPKGPTETNCHNEFLPRHHGPMVDLAINFAWPEQGAYRVTLGWWCADRRCWRYLDDDGPNDVQPEFWRARPAPPKEAAE